MPNAGNDDVSCRIHWSRLSQSCSHQLSYNYAGHGLLDIAIQSVQAFICMVRVFLCTVQGSVSALQAFQHIIQAALYFFEHDPQLVRVSIYAMIIRHVTVNGRPNTGNYDTLSTGIYMLAVITVIVGVSHPNGESYS